MKKRIAFIINPVSGVLNKKKIPVLINKKLNKNIFEPEFVFTKYAGHATELAQEFVEKGFNYIVAVGGDGTVHEVANAVRDTNACLGIIPTGSGNGLARHLHISINILTAIKQLNTAKEAVIDYCLMNGTPFFCTCGVGFDAYVSMEFDKVKIRGFFGYVRKIVVGFFKYKPQKYRLIYNNQTLETEAFLITLANASQWGFNAYIAPRASVKDGILNVTIVKKISFFFSALLAIKLFTKKIDNSKHITTLTCYEFNIHSNEEMLFHLDGDPFGKGFEVNVKVVPNGLRVIAPKTFQ